MKIFQELWILSNDRSIVWLHYMLYQNIQHICSNMIGRFFKTWRCTPLWLKTYYFMYISISGDHDCDVSCWRSHTISSPYRFEYKNLYGYSWTITKTSNDDHETKKVNEISVCFAQKGNFHSKNNLLYQHFISQHQLNSKSNHSCTNYFTFKLRFIYWNVKQETCCQKGNYQKEYLMKRKYLICLLQTV